MTKLKDRITLRDAPLTTPQRHVLDAIARGATLDDTGTTSYWCDIPDGAAFWAQRKVVDRLLALGLVAQVMRKGKFVFVATEAGERLIRMMPKE